MLEEIQSILERGYQDVVGVDGSISRQYIVGACERSVLVREVVPLVSDGRDLLFQAVSNANVNDGAWQVTYPAPLKP